jgi:hypothetical protein
MGYPRRENPSFIAGNYADRRACPGFGDAALFWIQRFGPATIDCLNIVRSQAKMALKRVRAEGLEERVRLHVGSATRMPSRMRALIGSRHSRPRITTTRVKYSSARPIGC